MEGTGNTILPLIQSFFSSLTEGPWESLKSGNPGSATKILLADLLLRITITLAKAVRATLTSEYTSVTKEYIESCLGDRLVQSFSHVLNLPDNDTSISTNCLSDLVITEVTEYINSALSSSKMTSSESVVYYRITPPETLNSMVCHATEMLKDFMTKTTCKPRTCRQEPILFPEEDVDIDDRFIPESRKQVSKAVHKKLCTELSSMMDSILDDMPHSSVELVKFQISQEVKATTDKITMSIATNLNESVSKEKWTETVQDLKSNLHNLFTKCVANGLIHRIMAQMINKFPMQNQRDGDPVNEASYKQD